MLRLPVAVAAPIVFAALAPTSRAIIIPQPNAPIEILTYDAHYQERSSYEREGISHRISYRNRGTQKVQAIRFGLVSFDVFNDFLDRTGGITTEDVAPGATTKSSWVASAYADFSFLTGVVYVSVVRLEDGTVLNADQSAVLAEMRKIEKDFNAKNLEEKKGGDKP
jgi:hypothetical protein